MNSLYGLKIVPHELAQSVVWRVERHPTKKRRRNWRPVRKTEPGMYIVGGQTVYIHPALYAKLLEATHAR